MIASQKLKTITKAYTAQFMNLQNQVLIYSPLQQWLERHSSTSISEMISIYGQISSYFMNTDKERIILQNEHKLMSLRQIDNEYNSKVCQNYQHYCALVSGTSRFNQKYFINLDERGCLNFVSLDISEQNPQSFKQISTKISVQGDTNKKLQSVINLKSLFKNQTNGFRFADLATSQEQIFTLHNFKKSEETFSMIYKTIIDSSQSITSPLRAQLPSSIKKLLVNGNSIWAYGLDNLILLDNGSESIVLQLNEFAGSQINCVKTAEDKNNLMYVSRDNSISLQDARKPSQIVQVVLRCDQNIESFVKILEDDGQIFCVSSSIDGRIHFYEK